MWWMFVDHPFRHTGSGLGNSGTSALPVYGQRKDMEPGAVRPRAMTHLGKKKRI